MEHDTEKLQQMLGEDGAALLWGYDCGLVWEYKNPYAPNHPLWNVYLYGYILGVMNVMPEDS